MDKRILYDKEDENIMKSHNWKIQVVSKNKEYVRSSSMLLHRLLMGNPVGMEVDHINGNSLDNRRINLRICTKSQNRANKSMYSNNTSGYKGVYWDKSKRKWKAILRFENKHYYLGRYDTPLEAAKAYNKGSLKIHGEYGNINPL